MARVPTVRIVRPDDPDDFIVINESDFDAATMTLWTDTPPPPPKPQAPTDKQERIEAICKAIEQLDPDNAEQWIGNGAPATSALEDILGWEVSAAERDEAWELHQKK